MTNALQLNLFINLTPSWNEVDINWLFSFLNQKYPEMKFKFDKDYDGETTIIQTISKKIKLEYHIGQYHDGVTWRKNKKFIGCTINKYYGDWGGIGETYDHMEEFLEFAEKRIKKCKEYIKESGKKQND